MSRFQTLTPASLSREAFIEAFADIYEHSPWVAEKAYDLGIDDSLNDIEGLHQRMADRIDPADRAAGHLDSLQLDRGRVDRRLFLRRGGAAGSELQGQQQGGASKPLPNTTCPAWSTCSASSRPASPPAWRSPNGSLAHSETRFRRAQGRPGKTALLYSPAHSPLPVQRIRP